MNSKSATSETDAPVPLALLGYFRARNRGRVHDLVLREFERQKISRADLARRLGKRPEQITRLLGGPGNWTLDTVSDLLFAISEAEIDYEITHPLQLSPRNQLLPDWIGIAPPSSVFQQHNQGIPAASIPLLASRLNDTGMTKKNKDQQNKLLEAAFAPA